MGKCTLLFNVNGTPKTKGSMRYIGGRMIEGNHGSKDWRILVAESAFAAAGGDGEHRPHGFPLVDIPLHIDLVFRFSRPKSRRFGDPITRTSGDIDKLARNVFDALQDAGIIGDDSQITSCTIGKRYVDSKTMPGVTVIVTWSVEES